MKNQIPLIVLLLCLPSLAIADHLVTGHISLQCLPDDNYEITLEVVRFCDSSSTAFDDPIILAIYSGNAAPYMLFETLEITYELVETEMSTLDDCLNGSAVCLEKATYAAIHHLPMSTESYHLVYQRCCFTEGIVNISDQDFGTTVAYELTPLAQQICNNSPVLSEHYFFEVCTGESFNFEITAMETDGHQLTYQWCAPWLGGGSMGTVDNPGDPLACDGVMPTPPCPPPFETSDFIAPEYTPDQPLGMGGSIQLNPNGGQMVGIAGELGHYLTAICITETFNGDTLSQIRKNIHFWVDMPASLKDQLISKPLEFLPNPAGQQVKIKLPKSASEGVLLVSSVWGEEVMTGHYQNDEELLLDVSAWPAGVYFVAFFANDERWIGKLLVDNF